MLQSWLNPLYLEDPKELMKIFVANKPTKHLVLTDFFNADKVRKVREELARQTFSRRESDSFQYGQTLLSNGILSELNDVLKSAKFRKIISLMTEKKIRKAEVMGFEHCKCDHVLPTTLKRGRIGFVFFLSDGSGGGELEFLDNTQARKISSAHNTFVIFCTSKNSYYQITEITSKQKKYFIRGWFNE